MYARLSWGKIQAGKWGAFETAFKDAVAKAGAQPGLKGRMLLRDSNDENAGFTLSLWESEKAMRDYEASDTMKSVVLPAIEPFFIGQYNTTFCEVCYSETE